MAYKSFKSLFSGDLREINGLIDDFDDCDFYQKRCSIRLSTQPLVLWRDSMKCAMRKIWPYMSNEERKHFKGKWKDSLQLGKVTKQRRTPEGTVTEIDIKKYNSYKNAFSEMTRLLRGYASKHNMLLTNKKSTNWEEPDDW